MSKKKKTYCGEEKSGSRYLLRGSVSSLQLQAYFDLLNVIIWTSSPAGKLFKIKFSSQVAMNHGILMNKLKATD